MLRLDTERLEHLLPRLQSLGIDLRLDELPAPDSQDWEDLVMRVSRADRALGQEMAGLVYDPEELANSELVASQVRQAQARSGVKDKLAPILTRKDVNGQEVPNYPLFKALAVAGGLGALGLLFFWQPSQGETVASASSTTTSSTTTSSTTTVDGVEGIAGPSDEAVQAGRNSDFSSFISGPETASGAGAKDTAALDPADSEVETVPTATLTPEPAPVYVAPAQPTYEAYPETQVYSVPDVNTSAPESQELSAEDQAALEALFGTGTQETPYVDPYAQTGVGTADVVVPDTAVPGSASAQTTLPPSEVVLLPAENTELTAAPVLSVEGGEQVAPPRLAASGGAAGAEGGAGSSRKLVASGGSGAGAEGGAAGTRKLMASGGSGAGAEGGAASSRGLIGLQTAAGGEGGQARTRVSLNSTGTAQTAQARSGVGLNSAGQREAGAAPALTPGLTGEADAPAQVEASRPTMVLASSNSAPARAQMTGAFRTGNSSLPVAGQQRPGALSYGVALVVGGASEAGQPGGANAAVPVYVRTADGIVWKGVPYLDGAKRVQIAFHQALVGGEVVSITADAYGMDGYPGVPANISTKAPTLVADVLNGFGKGALAFSQAFIGQSQRVESNGTTTVTRTNTPNFWVTAGSGVLSEAARFPSTQGGLVSVAEVRPGTPIQVVVRGE